MDDDDNELTPEGKRRVPVIGTLHADGHVDMHEGPFEYIEVDDVDLGELIARRRPN